MKKLTSVKSRVFAVLAALLIISGIGAGLVVSYRNNDASQRPIVYSNDAMLYETWVNYKKTYIEEGSNRTVDRQQNNITTSEGQSYTMMRSVWIDDKATFDRSWEWTQGYLQRQDKLFSWKYGERADGSYGILTDIGGQNTASDADVDIAMSLLLAYGKWGNDYYLREAQTIIPAIWEKEVVNVSGKPVLVANDLEKGKANVIVNPSYFAPYAYKTFAKIDPSRNWTALSDNSYDVISTVSKAPLDTETSSGLTPNWVEMSVASGQATGVTRGDLNTDYGYDAMRTSWRLALDYAWFKDDRAKQAASSLKFLADTYQSDGKLVAIYGHDGTAKADYESPAMYGTSIGYFMLQNPAAAKQLYDQKLTTLYNPDTQSWKQQLNYYDDNWTWFGLALYNDALPNLTEATK